MQILQLDQLFHWIEGKKAQIRIQILEAAINETITKDKTAMLLRLWSWTMWRIITKSKGYERVINLEVLGICETYVDAVWACVENLDTE